ncbi:hypothetical protein GCM10010273_18860 [Streptomyces lavendulocolor]
MPLVLDQLPLRGQVRAGPPAVHGTAATRPGTTDEGKSQARGGLADVPDEASQGLQDVHVRDHGRRAAGLLVQFTDND